MNKMKTTVIVEELMKELGYAAIKYSDPHDILKHAIPKESDVCMVWKLRHFIHEDNDKIWVYIMDDSNTSIRLWREPNMYTEQTRSQAFSAGPSLRALGTELGMLAAGIEIASSKVIDLTDPNSFVKVKKFLNRT